MKTKTIFTTVSTSAIIPAVPLACVALASLCLMLATGAQAADQTKANNATALNANGSWVSGTAVPGSGDHAIITSTMSTAQTCALGANQSWGQLEVASTATKALTISSGNTLTLYGLGAPLTGIDMSAAAAAGAPTINCAVALQNSQTWSVNSGVSLDVEGIISGSSKALTVAGPGSVTLGGVNTFSGGLTVSGNGRVVSTASTGIGASAGLVTVGNGSGIYLSTLSGAYTFANNFNINGNGWPGDPSPLGALRINSGMIVSGTVTLAGDARIWANAAGQVGTVSGVISDGGSGYALDTGGDTGTLILSGANTYGGATTISKGSLWLNNQNTLQDSTLTMTGQGTLLFSNGVSGKAFTFGGLAATASGTGYNLVLQNNGSTPAAIALTVGNNNANTAYAGVLSAAGSLTKIGTGTLTLSGANTYTGGTTVSAGTLQLGAANAVPGNTIAGDVSVNGTLDLNTFSEALNGLNGSGTVDTVAGGTPTLTVGANNDSGTFSGVIQNTIGTLALAKSGSGTETLSGPSSYTGGTTVSGGILTASANSALGTGAVSINSGATRVVITDGTTIANNLTINGGTGADGLGLIENSSTGNATLSGGTITINGSPASGGHFACSGSSGINGTLTIADPINSSVTINHRNGTVIFSGGGSYTSLATSGTAKLGANNGLSTSASVQIGASAGADTLDLAGYNQSLAGITVGVGGGTIGNSSTTADSLLTITGTSAYAGVIQDVLSPGIHKVALTVNGGTLTLSGANTYSGKTTISSGTLALGASSVLPSGTTVNLAGGTLAMSTYHNTVQALQSSGSVLAEGTWGASGSGANHISSSMTGTGILTVTTGGSSTISPPTSTANPSTYDGAATVSVTVTGAYGDGSAPTGTVTFYVDGSSVGTASLGSPSGVTATASLPLSATLSAGTHSITASYGGNASYDVSGTSATLTQTVYQAPVTITGVTAANKNYDGTVTAALSGGTISGTFNGDNVTFTAGTGAFGSQYVGTWPVTASGYALATSGISTNYSLSAQPTVPNASIAAKLLTVTGLSVPASKVYDGTTNTAAPGTPALLTAEAPAFNTGSDGTPYAGDTVSLSGSVTGGYDSKDVGTTNVTFTGLSTANTNYTVPAPTQAATITPKPLNYTGISVTDKVYDGTSAAPLSGAAATLATEAGDFGTGGDGAPYMGDTVSFTTGTLTGTFAGNQVGTGLAVTVTGGVSLTPGGQSGDYSVGLPSPELAADITPAALTVTANTTNKVYGQTLTFAGTEFSLLGLTNSDTVTNVTLSSGGTANTATVGIYTIAATNAVGSGLANYSISYVSGTLTVNPLVAALVGTRAYDGTTNVAGAILTVTNAVNSDVVTLSGTGGLASPYVGTSAITSLGSLALSGGAGTNYTLIGAGGAVVITNANPSTNSLVSSANPSGYLSAVTFTNILPADATGNVVFSWTNGPINTNTVGAGMAMSLSVTNLPRGTNVITAVYLGDTNYLGSTASLIQTVTNHSPVAATMTVTRTAGLNLLVRLSELATNWNDADGDPVTLPVANFNMVTTNGVNLIFSLDVTTDGTNYIFTTNSFVLYTNAPSVNDQFSYGISDGQGGTNIGYVNIVVNNSVTGTNSIVGIVTGNPTTLTAYGIPGYSYVTERATNLAPAVWVDISTNTAATNGVINVNDTFGDLGGIPPASAFYQLKWQP